MRFNTRSKTDQHGSGTMLMLAVALLAMALAGSVLLVVGYLVALHGARGAADLAALSGAAGWVRGGDSCQEARRVAAANDTQLVSCRIEGDSFDFVVSVTVARQVISRIPGLPTRVLATAHAGRLGPG